AAKRHLAHAHATFAKMCWHSPCNTARIRSNDRRILTGDLKRAGAMDPTTLATAAQEIDFSLLALFARATFTVKLVMILLIGMSFWAWAIIIQKHILFRKARADAQAFDQAFWSGEP